MKTSSSALQRSPSPRRLEPPRSRPDPERDPERTRSQEAPSGPDHLSPVRCDGLLISDKASVLVFIYF